MAGCSTGLTCCSTHCSDGKNDSAHCGACGTACAATAFCGMGTCHDTLLSSVCAVGKIAVVLDGRSADEVPGRSVGAALMAKCAPAPAVRETAQDSADISGVANPTTGEPVAGGDELLVVSGGFFFAKIAGYSEKQPVAPIYAQQNGDVDEYVNRATGAAVATFPVLENTSDYVFVIQFMRDPLSGSLILNTQGFFEGATAIAAQYFNEQLLPTVETLSKSWYVYHWVDDASADHLMQPSEVTLVDSGP